MEQLRNAAKKVHQSRFFPLLVFGLLGLIALSGLILNNTLILSVDTLFHFNRFYDTAEQIKNGTYNYFQMNYGFSQTGRIVNALYGPAIAYLGGLILYLSYNWIVFEIAISMFAMLVAAFSMYWLCRVNNVKRDYAIIIGGLYMTGSSVFGWVSTQQFTGFGAAFVPFFFIGVTLMLRRLKIPVIGISVGMAILMQTHILSSLIAFSAAVPMIIVSLILTKNKWQMIRDGIITSVLTLALTINVWGVMLSIFKNNYLIPTFPNLEMQFNTVSFEAYSLQTIAKPMELLIFLYVTYYIITRWKRLDYVFRTIGSVAVFFFVLSTNALPWERLQFDFPKLTTLIQFPKRFVVIPFVLFFLLLGMILSTDKNALTLKPLHYPSRVFTMVLLFFVYALNMETNFQSMNVGISQTVAMKQSIEAQLPVNHAFSYDKKFNRTYKQDFESHNKTYLIQDIIKTTPDYLPSNVAVNEANYYQVHPYRNNHIQLIKHNFKIKGGYTKKVNKDGSMTITWRNHHSKTTRYRVTVVKYAATKLVLNGKKVKPVNISKVGAITVNAKPGKNVLKVSYRTGLGMDVIFLVTVVSWMGVICYVIIKRFKNKKSNQ
ncbi:hypothetical protein [Apilactobacillus nanyangensis]|uniref:hypothetical protein n=1 Tax=Apilactobacillus nanyangensis TaxID=2799579 RepID=UPI00194085F9|nr:hypothetical protein [Apilactobacillus nanyangensis]